MSLKDMIPWRRDRQEVPVQRVQTERWNAPSFGTDFGLAPFFQQTEQLFDRFFQGFGGSLFGDLRGWGLPSRELGPSLALDLRETKDAFHVSIELPGVDEKDLDLSISDGALHVRGEKRTEHESEQGDMFRMERSYGRFERVIPLPAEVDEDRVRAGFRRGVLEVELPKSPQALKQVKRIPVHFADR